MTRARWLLSWALWLVGAPILFLGVVVLVVAVLLHDGTGWNDAR